MLIMQNKKNKTEWFRIRKAVASPELYMQADGTWGAWKTAKRFRVSTEAEAFAEAHTKDPFGLFTYQA